MVVSDHRPVGGKPPTRSTACGQSPHRLAGSSGSLRDAVRAIMAPELTVSPSGSPARGGGPATMEYRKARRFRAGATRCFGEPPSVRYRARHRFFITNATFPSAVSCSGASKAFPTLLLKPLMTAVLPVVSNDSTWLSVSVLPATCGYKRNAQDLQP